MPPQVLSNCRRAVLLSKLGGADVPEELIRSPVVQKSGGQNLKVISSFAAPNSTFQEPLRSTTFIPLAKIT